MTFTSIAAPKTQIAANNLTDLKTTKLSKSSVATSLLAIVGFTLLPNLLWMSASHPAELPTHNQAIALTTAK